MFESYNNRREKKGSKSFEKERDEKWALYHACCGLALYSLYKARLKKLISDSFSVQDGKASVSQMPLQGGVEGVLTDSDRGERCVVVVEDVVVRFVVDNQVHGL